jgi:hypothetical protein
MTTTNPINTALTRSANAGAWFAKEGLDISIIRNGAISLGVIASNDAHIWANRARDGETAKVENRQAAIDFLLNR